MDGFRRLLIAAGVAGAVLATIAVPAGAEGVIILLPSSGPPGTEVAATSPVLTSCPLFRLYWGSTANPPLGSVDDPIGTATVRFRVPQAPAGKHRVIGTCSSGGGQTRVASAEFTVIASVGSTTTTTIEPGATTSTSTAGSSTTRPNSSSSTTRPPTASTRPPGSGPAGSTSTVVDPAAAPSRPVPKDIDECDRIARESESQLVYQPDRTMTFGNSYEVVVKLALDEIDAKAVEIPGSSPTTIVTVGGTQCTVEAELTSADFEITPGGAQPQSFLDARVLTWRWQVAPRWTGTDLRLLLRLQPIWIEEGKPPRPGSGEFFEAVIEVESKPQSLISKVNRGITGVFGHALVQYLLIPSGGGVLTVWLWSRFRKKKEAGT